MFPFPFDTTEMGAGMGPLGMNATPMNYTENRGTLHLHGGFLGLFCRAAHLMGYPGEALASFAREDLSPPEHALHHADRTIHPGSD